MASPDKTGTFVVMVERKSTTGSNWRGDDTRKEHHRFREVFDERFSTATAAQAAAMGMLKDPARAKTRDLVLVIAELRSKIISKVDVSTKVQAYNEV